MKKLLYIGALSALLLVACGGEESKTIEKEVEVNVAANAEVEVEEEKASDKEVSTIDTSVFEYATSVEVTDARSITKNITLKIDLANNAQAGMGTKNVVTQMYDFLQQSDIDGAETVTYFIRVNDKKVAQFKTTVNEFKPDDSQSMVSVVLAATEIESLSDEVKSFGQATELWN